MLYCLCADIVRFFFINVFPPPSTERTLPETHENMICNKQLGRTLTESNHGNQLQDEINTTPSSFHPLQIPRTAPQVLQMTLD